MKYNNFFQRVGGTEKWFVGALALLIPLSLEAAPTTALLRSEPAPIPPLALDWSGRTVGASNGQIIVIGGGQPEARVVSFLTPGNEWKQVSLAADLSWSSLAQEDQSFICVGGLEAGQASASVRRLRWNDGKIAIEPLPSLPKPLLGAGAGVVKDVLYVVGGVASSDATTAGNELYALDLTRLADGWKMLEPLPGSGRVLPTVVSQYGVLQVFGGRETRTNAAGTPEFQALADVWIYRPKPLEGTNKRGWLRGESMPQARSGASGAAVGQAQTLVTGGDDTPVVTELWKAGTGAAESPVLSYHLVTDVWTETGVTTALAQTKLVATGAGKFWAFGANVDGSVAEITGIRSVRNLSWVDYVVIAAYFVFIAWIGFYFSAKQESTAEFSLGNREVKWWAAGISMFATGASAISFMAIPALAFSTNLVWLFPLLAFIPAYFVQAHLILPLLRRLEITSTYEYLERRFNRTLRVIACVQCMLLQTFGRSSIVLVLPSLAISATTGINVYVSVLIMGVLTTIYTAIGGFEAVIWTEVFQGLLKFFAPLVMIGICLANLPGGVSEFIEVGLTHDKFVFALPTWDITVPAVWLLLFSTFLTTTLGMAGDQPIIQRIFSAPLSEVRRVTAMSTACGVLIGIIVNVMGLAIFCYFRAHPEKFDAMAQNDQIVPLFVTQALPQGVAGMVIAAIFASAMATVASAMNSVATIYTEDIYRHFRPQADDAARLRTMKITSYVVGFLGTAIALVLASMNLKSIMVVWSQIVALMGGGIVGVYSLGMFTKRANGFGAIIGAIASVFVTAGIKAFTPLHWATYMPIAILTCIGVGYAASFFRTQDTRNLNGLTVFADVKNPTT